MDLKKITERLWNLYFIGKDDELLELHQYFAPECVVIGTGKHEIYHSAAEFFLAMQKELQERNKMQFQFKDFWCRQIDLSNETSMVYGGLFIWWESDDKSISINMDSRFTMVFKQIEGSWKIVHVHQSMPNLEQKDGEYYPKTLSEQVKEGQEKIDVLLELASKDGLTGLINFRTFQEIFKNCDEKDKWLFVIDLDHFKEINDTYGHVEGNAILKEVSKILQSTVRSNDYVCRMGGDEFILLCSQLESQKLAQALVERILFTINSTLKGITISIGGTKINKGDSLETALKRADQALYEVKFSGKNNWKILNE